MARFSPSRWKFVTSAGIDVSVSAAPLVVAGQLGDLYVRDPESHLQVFRYISVGGGLGVGLGIRGGLRQLRAILSVLNIDFFTTEMDSGNIGTIWRGPGSPAKELTLDDFNGDSVALAAQAGAGGGGTIALIVCAPRGTLERIAAVASPTAVVGPSLLLSVASIATIVSRCRCAGLMWGTTLGLQVGASVATLYGTMRYAGPRS